MGRFENAEVTQHSMKLEQLGAKVRVVDSKLCYVDFDLSGLKLQYVYNVNKKGNYFLERIKPYPLALKEFELEQDIVEIIAIDVEQFKNALKSHNISKFIDIARKLNFTLKKFEDLFLYYNISSDEVDKAFDQLREFDENIEMMKKDAERLYFKKNPDNLKD